MAPADVLMKKTNGLIVLFALLLSAATVLIVPRSAEAVEGPLVANAASSWQTNGTVRALAVSNGVVYLGGDFTSVRPPGDPRGTGEVPRSYLVAFDAATGDLMTNDFLDHSLNDTVRSLLVSPDGTVLYVGGNFTTVD